MLFDPVWINKLTEVTSCNHFILCSDSIWLYRLLQRPLMGMKITTISGLDVTKYDSNLLVYLIHSAFSYYSSIPWSGAEREDYFR